LQLKFRDCVMEHVAIYVGSHINAVATGVLQLYIKHEIIVKLPKSDKNYI
jgi:hypothetical protein